MGVYIQQHKEKYVDLDTMSDRNVDIDYFIDQLETNKKKGATHCRISVDDEEGFVALYYYKKLTDEESLRSTIEQLHQLLEVYNKELNK